MTKEHFTLFSRPMVRAILDGLKSQTRRIVVPNNSTVDGGSARTIAGRKLWDRLDFSRAWIPATFEEKISLWGYAPAIAQANDLAVPTRDNGKIHRVGPYVRMGDVMLVKETSFDVRPYRDASAFQGVKGDFLYRADDAFIGCHPWRPSILMPRAAVRLRLPVIATRPERLQAISEEDSIAEGVDAVSMEAVRRQATLTRKQDYRQLWNTINYEPGKRWEDNPWVWVREFMRA